MLEAIGQMVDDEGTTELPALAAARANVNVRDMVKPAYREADRVAREMAREVSDTEEALADACAALVLSTIDEAAVVEAERELEAAVRKHRRYQLAARSLKERL